MQDLKFSWASDCWSFGVVLIEILNNGVAPYIGLSNPEVISQVRSKCTILNACINEPDVFDRSLFRYSPAARLVFPFSSLLDPFPPPSSALVVSFSKCLGVLSHCASRTCWRT